MDANENYRGLSPYEVYKMSEKRRPSGTAIGGLAVGIGAAVAAVVGIVYNSVYANSRARGVETLAVANHRSNEATIDRLANLLAAERSERVAQGVTMSQTITDTISGQQQGSQNQTTSVENSAMAAATTQLLTQSLLGNLSENAQKVQIYSAPQPCPCPGCGA